MLCSSTANNQQSHFWLATLSAASSGPRSTDALLSSTRADSVLIFIFDLSMNFCPTVFRCSTPNKNGKFTAEASFVTQMSTAWAQVIESIAAPLELGNSAGVLLLLNP